MRKALFIAVAALAFGCATTNTTSTANATTTQDSDGVTITEQDMTPELAARQQAQASTDANRAHPETEVVCVEEAAVGSHIPKKVCRTRLKAKQQRDDAQSFFESPQPANTNFGK